MSDRRADVDEDAVSREVREELDAHLAARVHDNLARGLTPAAARDEARRRFGSPSGPSKQLAAAARGNPYRLATGFLKRASSSDTFVCTLSIRSIELKSGFKSLIANGSLTSPTLR